MELIISRSSTSLTLVMLLLVALISSFTSTLTDAKHISQSEPCRASPCFCTMEYKPVCGSNGRTYGSACGLRCAQLCSPGLMVAYNGECGGKHKVRENRQRRKQKQKQRHQHKHKQQRRINVPAS